MVEDREIIENLNRKIKNLLKHLPCRRLKLSQLVVKELNEDTQVAVIIIDTPEPQNIILTLPLSLSCKDILFEVSKAIPEKYKSLEIKNVQSALKLIKYNFNTQKIPDSFLLTKVPYRQLALKIDNHTAFINLSTSTYQKILHVLDLNENLDYLDFDKIAVKMRRKELVVLLLSMSTFNK